ncbi:MAG TPA: tetratricopeptide repeat protein, partial [Anaerolineales bacterium]|nr:tetratricopeptide repeat protein [Anaerolineales bacterium]
MMEDYENAIKAYQKAEMFKEGILLSNDSALDAPQLDTVSEAVTAPKTVSDFSDKRSEASPVEESAVQTETVSGQETPYWVFQSADENEDVTTKLFQSSSHLFGSKLNNSTVQSATSIQEIGDLPMQMILPFISNKEATRLDTSSVVEAKLAPNEKASHARIWNEKGNMLLREGAFEDAITAYNKAIKYDRSFGWPYTNLGIAYLQLGKYAEAVLLLQKSLELLKTGKEQAVVWNELGNLYRCLNDYHNAVVSYQKSDELDPDLKGTHETVEYLHNESTVGNLQVWYELGDSFFKSGSYDEATNCYRKVTEMAPLNGWAFNLLALSLTYQSKYEEAVPVYLKSIELLQDDKEKAKTWNSLGNVYRRLNDYSNAVDAYQNAVKLNKETATLLTRTRFSLLGNCNVD